MHDIGLVFLDTPITLASSSHARRRPKQANNTQVVNIGRIDNGTLSTTALYVSCADRDHRRDELRVPVRLHLDG